VCCSVLQCVAVRCSVLQWDVSWIYCPPRCTSVAPVVAVCCTVLQCVAVCCSVLQCVAVCCSEMYIRYTSPRVAHQRHLGFVVVCCKKSERQKKETAWRNSPRGVLLAVRSIFFTSSLPPPLEASSANPHEIENTRKIHAKKKKRKTLTRQPAGSPWRFWFITKQKSVKYRNGKFYEAAHGSIE